jgi:hypothetical protein
MPITREKRVIKTEVRDDELLYVFEEELALDNGVIFASRQLTRVIDPDAVVTNEDPLIRDVALGLYTQERKDRIRNRGITGR